MNEITKVFGLVKAADRETAARESTRKFVRSKSEIGPLYEDRKPTGHIMTAWEAYQNYGFEILEESIEYSGAILLESVGAIERTFFNRRNDLGLSVESVAGAAGVGVDVVKQAELLAGHVSVKELEKIAFVLGLDERLLAFDENGSSDRDLAFRLKTLQQPSTKIPEISAGTVLRFTEAASIIRVQAMLMDWLGQSSAVKDFQPSSDYGRYPNPAWKVGYRLAEQTRARLGLGIESIPSMRELVEDTLDIPVVQARLHNSIAGATITTRGSDGSEVRGFVLNTIGENSNVWVRRATLAHELGHILYDPSQELKHLRVDSYMGTQSDPEGESSPDYVEQRANAFAIAFLAPLDSVRDLAPAPINAEAVGEVMQTFGISHTAARYHVSNAHYRQYALPGQIYNVNPGDEWLIAEDFTLDYFPAGSVPLQRRGRFAGLVAECHQRRMLSSQTAALYLGCDEQDFLDNVESIRDLHPIDNV